MSLLLATYNLTGKDERIIDKHRSLNRLRQVHLVQRGDFVEPLHELINEDQEFSAHSGFLSFRDLTLLNFSLKISVAPFSLISIRTAGETAFLKASPSTDDLMSDQS